MATIAAAEAQACFADLLDQVERGEEVVITRDGRPVARLVGEGIGPGGDAEAFLREIEGLRTEGAAWRQAQRKPPVTVDEIVALAREGRR